jgi:hypothetical protein
MFADGGGGQDAEHRQERERECGCGGDWLEKTEVDLVDRYLKLMAQLIEMRDRGRAEPARHDSAPPLDELLVRLERAGDGGMHDALRRAAENHRPTQPGKAPADEPREQHLHRRAPHALADFSISSGVFARSGRWRCRWPRPAAPGRWHSLSRRRHSR